MPFRFEPGVEDGGTRARRGRLVTPHGAVETPAFMPVGTRAAVKAMAPGELWSMGYRLVLANAYHLAVRPGSELVREMGGLARFMGFRGATLTDSGGFQAMSLAKINSISEAGIRFRSHLDGASIMLTPERAIEIQEHLGADIMMALDECTSYPATRERAAQSLELTARWAKRSLEARRSPDQALFGIIQGGIYGDLRRRSAGQITSLEFDGFATGGLSVGEPKAAMLEMAALAAAAMPADRPRYLMGVGTPEDLIAAIGMGYDMFDCVLPTRNGRHGVAFTRFGAINLRNARHIDDPRPLDEESHWPSTREISRAYLHHLVRSGETLGAMLLSEINIAYYQRLMSDIRAAIAQGRFDEFYQATRQGWARGDVAPLTR
jgi:queuine tRNA-ribosyltransferase